MCICCCQRPPNLYAALNEEFIATAGAEIANGVVC